MTSRPILTFLAATSLLLSGCLRPPEQAYFTSPFNGYSNDYHPLPEVRDSAHTAVYTQASILTGDANVRSRDAVTAFRGSFTVAHHGKWLQAYYGGSLTLGGYHMGKWDTGYSNSPYWQGPPPQYSVGILNSYTGSHFFGGAGFHGGANLVIPFRDGEWRVFGVETSLYHEFGNYLSIRRKLPDTAATLIIRDPFYGTVGFSSELIGSVLHGEFGFRMSGGVVLGSLYKNPNIYDYASGNYLTYGYLSLTSHLTYGRYTGYGQLNFATKAFSLSLGMIYRLTRPRNTPPIPPHRRRQLLLTP